VLDSSGNATFAGTPVPNSSFLRNRIINGDMRIDQRNAGAAIASLGSGSTYTVDRFYYYGSQSGKFSFQQNQGSVTPPAGFSNYAGFTSLSAFSAAASDVFVLGQVIEGYNISDLAWGTANAKSVTVSFWVRSSITGTHSGFFGNSNLTRSYPFTFTVSSANTWTQISVTIAGDTTGTYSTTNGAGIYVGFNLGCGSTFLGTAGSWQAALYEGATGSVSIVGTNGATFYITGVQLEVGTAATPFERRQYGQELALCQRYFEKSYNQSDALGAVTTAGRRMSIAFNTGDFFDVGSVKLSVTKRTSATITLYSPATGASGKLYNYSGSADVNGAVGSAGETAFLTTGTGGSLAANSFYGWHFAASAEL